MAKMDLTKPVIVNVQLSEDLTVKLKFRLPSRSERDAMRRILNEQQQKMLYIMRSHLEKLGDKRASNLDGAELMQLMLTEASPDARAELMKQIKEAGEEAAGELTDLAERYLVGFEDRAEDGEAYFEANGEDILCEKIGDKEPWRPFIMDLCSAAFPEIFRSLISLTEPSKVDVGLGMHLAKNSHGA